MKKSIFSRITPEPGSSILETKEQPTNIPGYTTFNVGNKSMPNKKSYEETVPQKNRDK